MASKPTGPGASGPVCGRTGGVVRVSWPSAQWYHPSHLRKKLLGHCACAGETACTRRGLLTVTSANRKPYSRARRFQLQSPTPATGRSRGPWAGAESPVPRDRGTACVKYEASTAIPRSATRSACVVMPLAPYLIPGRGSRARRDIPLFPRVYREKARGLGRRRTPKQRQTGGRI